jgi:hypothetical protein
MEPSDPLLRPGIAAIGEGVGECGRSRFPEEAAWEKLERLELEATIRDGAGS